MSRGPGALQRRILEMLAREPIGYLPWRWLKERFPLQVRDKSFYRAIRSLRTTKRIDDYTLDRGLGPGPYGRAHVSLAESFVSTLKRELIHRHSWPNRQTARTAFLQSISRVSTTPGADTPRWGTSALQNTKRLD